MDYESHYWALGYRWSTRCHGILLVTGAMRAKMADDDDNCYTGGRADIVVGFDDESYGEAQN